MPSLIITGHPCTGKTSFVRLLTKRVNSSAHPSITDVIHISEASACQLPQWECYASSSAEKSTRAALKSQFDQHVNANANSQSTLVILDSLNYIKGYRYELYCISKAAAQRHGVVWITDPNKSLDQVHQMKQNDGESKTSTSDILDELVARFEPPDDRNRWENPLYKVDVSTILPWDENGTIASKFNSEHGDNDGTTTSQQMKPESTVDAGAQSKPMKSASGFKRNKKVKPKPSAPSAVTSPSTIVSTQAPSGPISMASRNLPTASNTAATSEPENTTIEQVIDSILNSFLSTKPLTEGLSTANQASAETNVLNTVDAVSQRVNNEILKAIQDLARHDGKINVNIGGSGGNQRVSTLSSQDKLNSTALRSLRAQFLKWTSSHPSSSGRTEEEIAENYIGYIETVAGGNNNLKSSEY